MPLRSPLAGPIYRSSSTSAVMDSRPLSDESWQLLVRLKQAAPVGGDISNTRSIKRFHLFISPDSRWTNGASNHCSRLAGRQPMRSIRWGIALVPTTAVSMVMISGEIAANAGFLASVFEFEVSIGGDVLSFEDGLPRLFDRPQPNTFQRSVVPSVGEDGHAQEGNTVTAAKAREFPGSARSGTWWNQ